MVDFPQDSTNFPERDFTIPALRGPLVKIIIVVLTLAKKRERPTKNKLPVVDACEAVVAVAAIVNVVKVAALVVVGSVVVTPLMMLSVAASRFVFEKVVIPSAIDLVIPSLNSS